MTAHHRDDQAETVLLQLLRGTGVQGLAAMPMEAPFAKGRLLRPLLMFTRDELEAYARQHRLDWIEDASNADQSLARNYLRHRVMPVLRERWHDMSDSIARAARHSADAALLLDDLARMDLAESVHAEAGLSVPALLKLSRPRVRNLLRHWVSHKGLPVPSTQQLEHLILHVFQPTRTAHALVTWPGAEVRRYRDILTAMPPLTDIDQYMELLWDPDQPLEIPGTDYRLSTITARGQGLSLLRTRTTPLWVRFRRGGEICVLAGRGHHHKLKKLFQEAGIPPWERYRFPLVYVGADLAAIGDRWVCEPYAAGPEEQGIRVVMSKTVCNGVKLSGRKIRL
jgi:tRNA(Ile)-lysidine synthase